MDIIKRFIMYWPSFANQLEETMKYNACQNDFRYAEPILKLLAFKSEEIVFLLEWFEGYGGYCDCEILMNVSRHIAMREGGG